ncbi:hypothetical protein [Diaphorobacter nitroreducens]|uniref:hypothetical protein n=1 Tax=Diaphorobacter nitroreducens TaxID=164759 RepID=UPI001F455EE7|nr:hypothetical protein [Diaphorobacter nitroreducens]
MDRQNDPNHRQKGIYSLTESSIQLVPLLAHMAAWGGGTRIRAGSYPCAQKSWKKVGLRCGTRSWPNCVTSILARHLRRAPCSMNFRPRT